MLLKSSSAVHRKTGRPGELFEESNQRMKDWSARSCRGTQETEQRLSARTDSEEDAHGSVRHDRGEAIQQKAERRQKTNGEEKVPVDAVLRDMFLLSRGGFG